MAERETSSQVWNYFKTSSKDNPIAKCRSCGREVKRGKTPRTFSTHPLWLHLKNHHLATYKEANKDRKQAVDEKESELKKKESIYKLKEEDDDAEDDVPDAKQPRIDAAFGKLKPYASDSKQQLEYEKFGAEWICSGLLPASFMRFLGCF
jgi:hypothetical protein